MSQGLWNDKYSTEILQVAADTTVARGTALKLSADSLQVTPVTAPTDRVHGFLNHGSQTNLGAINGESIELYREGGEAFALSAKAIAKDSDLFVTADGRVTDTVPARTNADQEFEVVGYAIKATSAANQLVHIMFTRTKKFLKST